MGNNGNTIQLWEKTYLSSYNFSHDLCVILKVMLKVMNKFSAINAYADDAGGLLLVESYIRTELKKTS